MHVVLHRDAEKIVVVHLDAEHVTHSPAPAGDMPTHEIVAVNLMQGVLQVDDPDQRHEVVDAGIQ